MSNHLVEYFGNAIVLISSKQTVTVGRESSNSLPALMANIVNLVLSNTLWPGVYDTAYPSQPPMHIEKDYFTLKFELSRIAAS